MKLIFSPRFVLAILLVLLLAGAIGYGYRLYRQPRQTAAEKSPEISIAADALYQAFSINEQQADQLYLNKVVAVSGVVEELDTTGGRFVVFLKTGGAGMINCSMLEAPDFSWLHHPVTVKGRCTGYLLDVLLLDGTIQSIP
jgi:hypothetical protein